MFNEIKEYNEYLNISSIENNRLTPVFTMKDLTIKEMEDGTYKVSFGGFCGLTRALTIIARNSVHSGEALTVDNATEKAEFALKSLDDWCQNVFIKYIELLSKQKTASTPKAQPAVYEAMKNDFDKKLERYKKDMYYNRKLESEDNIYFDQIVADAIEQGPLLNIGFNISRTFLSLLTADKGKKKDTEMSKIKTVKYNKETEQEEDASLSTNFKNDLIYLIAFSYYLRGAKQESYIDISFSDFGNWLGWTNRKQNAPIKNARVNIGGEFVKVFKYYEISSDEDKSIFSISDELFDFINKNGYLKFFNANNGISQLDGYISVVDKGKNTVEKLISR